MLELPPFPLALMDAGRPLQRVPRAVARVAIEGEEWILRPCNGLLFARREANNVHDWTFVAMKPLANDALSASRLIELWSNALRNRKIARFVVYEPSFLYRALPLFFAQDGTGWMREFWNRDDFPFRWDIEGQTGGVLTRPVEDFAGLGEHIFNQFLFEPLDQWNETHPEEPAYLNEELHFVCGSQSELERVCRMICYSDGLMSLSRTGIKVDIRSESGGERAGIGSLSFESFEFEQVHPRDRNVLGGSEWYGEAPSPKWLRLFEMALEENTPVGFNWEYNDQGTGRASHSPEALTLSFDFSPPSNHERLEARLDLRDWLLARVSSQEMEELLEE